MKPLRVMWQSKVCYCLLSLNVGAKHRNFSIEHNPIYFGATVQYWNLPLLPFTGNYSCCCCWRLPLHLQLFVFHQKDRTSGGVPQWAQWWASLPMTQCVPTRGGGSYKIYTPVRSQPKCDRWSRGWNSISERWNVIKIIQLCFDMLHLQEICVPQCPKMHHTHTHTHSLPSLCDTNDTYDHLREYLYMLLVVHCYYCEELYFSILSTGWSEY